MNITYNVSSLRREENPYRSVPHDTARALSIPLLNPMACRRRAYALRYLDDLRDPLQALIPDYQTRSLGAAAYDTGELLGFDRGAGLLGSRFGEAAEAGLEGA